MSLTFLREFLRHPKSVGSIMPTSRFVAARILRHIHSDVRTVVEYGPGTGAVTQILLKYLPTDCKLVAIEANSTFVDLLQQIDDSRLCIVKGDASDVAKYCEKPDIILSALPFRAFSNDETYRILDSTRKHMRKDSAFIVYLQYTRTLESCLQNYFSTVNREYEWRNVPPTNIYTCGL